MQSDEIPKMPSPFVKGNSLWAIGLNNRLQPNKLFNDPADLVKAIADYFQWVESNPFQEKKLVTYEGNSTLEDIPKARTPTLNGILLWTGMSRTFWGDIKQGRKRTDLHDVVVAAEQAMHDWKFSGAAAGLFNAQIIMRDLNLVERTLLGSDPEHPLPAVTTYQLPSNNRDPVEAPKNDDGDEQA
jgi:hypothetical protein